MSMSVHLEVLWDKNCTHGRAGTIPGTVQGPSRVPAGMDPSLDSAGSHFAPPAAASSAQLSHHLPSECTECFWARAEGAFCKSCMNKLHLAGRMLPCSSLLVKGSSRTGSLIQKYPRREAGPGELGPRQGWTFFL